MELWAHTQKEHGNHQKMYLGNKVRKIKVKEASGENWKAAFAALRVFATLDNVLRTQRNRVAIVGCYSNSRFQHPH